MLGSHEIRELRRSDKHTMSFTRIRYIAYVRERDTLLRKERLFENAEEQRCGKARPAEN
jgi:hypothetical protein